MPNELTGVLSGSSSIIRTQPLTATENGTYNPPSGVDGYKPVVVNVPQPQPVIEQLTATYNGIYNAPSGVDGYNPVVVNVPAPAPVLDDITITENGHYVPPTGVDGYDDITVNVPVPAPVLDDITITENGHYVPPTGVDGYDDITVNVPLPANAYLKQTLSGLPSPIATFTGADAPLDSLKASIEGVQDLHGYDSPWVAGGGKNKCDLVSNYSVTTDGITVETTTDGEIWVHGTPTISSGYISFTHVGNVLTTVANQTVTFSVSEKTVGVGFLCGSANGALNLTLSDIVRYKTGPYQSGGNYEVSVNVRFDVGTINKKYKLQVELGSNLTDWTPYSNICPISGWSEANVTVTDDLTNPTYTHTYTILFKDSSNNPINVYRGTIDISTGVATFNRIVKIYNGSETWRKSSTYDGSFYLPASAVPDRKPDTAFSCNMAKYVDSNYAYGTCLGTSGQSAMNFWIAEAGTTLEDFQTWLASNNLQVEYELTNPIIMHFDPIALRSNGITNISVNCGEVTELKYYTQS